jgi:hypothetical protein
MMKFIHPNHESNRMVSMSGKGGWSTIEIREDLHILRKGEIIL